MGHRNLNYLRWCLEQDMNNINDWFLATKLTLNINKLSCVLFNRNKNKVSLSIKINNNPVPQCSHVKFLGLWLDENLDWNHHCNSILNKIKRNTYLLRMGQDCLTQHVLNLSSIHIYKVTYNTDCLCGATKALQSLKKQYKIKKINVPH